MRKRKNKLTIKEKKRLKNEENKINAEGFNRNNDNYKNNISEDKTLFSIIRCLELH